MAGNLTQIMMDAEADANRDIASRDMQHTISGGASADALIRHATGDLANATGDQIHTELMHRVEEQRHLMESLGEGSQFFDYKNSSVGGIGNNREVRRELTLRSRQERVRREQRFGKAKRPVPTRKRSDRGDKRQAFNAGEDASSLNPREQGDRQAFNANENVDVAQPRTYFQEPPSRNYDPYA